MQNDHEALKLHSIKIGSDLSLVQGAGGNVSLKDKDTLIIKASGTRLKDALIKNIFIPISNYKKLIDLNEDLFTSSNIDSPLSQLRPSIETSMHAVIPHKIVSHVHSLGAIYVSTKKNFQLYLAKIKNILNVEFVPYARPGFPLTKQILKVLKENTEALLLQNHGLVVWGKDISEVEFKLYTLESHWRNNNLSPVQNIKNGFIEPIPHEWIQILVNGILTPDEVVFLGRKPFSSGSETDESAVIFDEDGLPYLKRQISNDAAEVASLFINMGWNMDNETNTNYLSENQVNELLDWDMEKMRQKMQN